MNSIKIRMPLKWNLILASICLCLTAVIIPACKPQAIPTAPGNGGGSSATVLVAGDIAFTAYAASGSPDSYEFVLLKAIGAGTQINFTDKGWDASAGAFYSGENLVTWTADHSYPLGTSVIIGALNATLGTVIDSSGSSPATTSLGFGLPEGDQVLAFQGSSSSPTFLAALSMTPWQTSGPVTFKANSYVPQGLTNGVNCLAFSAINPGEVYNCAVTSGSVASIRSAIYNETYWTVTDGTSIPVSTICDWGGAMAPTATWTSTPTTTPTPTTTSTFTATITGTIFTSTPSQTPTMTTTPTSTNSPVSGSGTVLGAGDVVFTGYAYTGSPKDNYAFILLPAVSAGTTLFITDEGWDATLNSGAGGLTSGEGIYCWTTASDLPAGTLVQIGMDGITPSVGMNVSADSSGLPTGLSSSGDQLLAYQGSNASPTFVGAMNLVRPWQTSGAISGNSDSYLPPGLTDGSTAWANTGASGFQVGYYDCSNGTTGSSSALRALVLNTSHWVYDSTDFNIPNGVLCAFNGAAGSPTLTPTETSSPTFSDTATPTETFADTDTATQTQTWTVSSTATDSSTPSDTASATPTSSGTEPPTDTATVTDSPTDSPTNSSTPSITNTIADTDTPTVSSTPTETSTVTESSTSTATVTPLAPGDLAFTGIVSATANQFAFMTLTDFPSGTSINFTNFAWDGSLSTPAFVTRTGSNAFDFTLNATGDISAGTQFWCGTNATGTGFSLNVVDGTGTWSTPSNAAYTFNTGTKVAFKSGEDQVFAYQGSFSNPSFLAGMAVYIGTSQSEPGAWNNSGSPTGGSGPSTLPWSWLPTSLSSSPAQAVVFNSFATGGNNFREWRYGPMSGAVTTGTQTDLQSALSDYTSSPAASGSDAVTTGNWMGVTIAGGKWAYPDTNTVSSIAPLYQNPYAVSP